MSFWKKGYYSYSKLWCYLKDPQEYYRNYVLGQKDPPSAPMILGRVFSEIYAGFDSKLGGVCELNFKGEKKLKYTIEKMIENPQKYFPDIPKEIAFRPHMVRIINTALKDKNLFRLPMKYCEQAVYVNSKICPLGAKHDGRIKKDGKVLIVENKFGRPWTEERANEEDQITFYSYVDYLFTGVIPTVRLQSINSSTGKVLSFTTRKKTKADFAALEEKIEYAYKGITNEVYEKV